MPDDDRSFGSSLTSADPQYWPAAERLLSLPPGWLIRRDGSFAWLDPTPSFEWYWEFYNAKYHDDPTHAQLLRNPRILERKRA